MLGVMVLFVILRIMSFKAPQCPFACGAYKLCTDVNVSAALGGIFDIDSAESIAIANGAELTELDDQRLTDGTIEVVVSMGDATSAAVAFDTWFDATPTLEP